MKTRKEVAEFINSGTCYTEAKTRECGQWHFELVELRLLMDFIYECEPKDGEHITKIE